jgi:hypothetical protein
MRDLRKWRDSLVRPGSPRFPRNEWGARGNRLNSTSPGTTTAANAAKMFG